MRRVEKKRKREREKYETKSSSLLFDGTAGRPKRKGKEFWEGAEVV